MRFLSIAACLVLSVLAGPAKAVIATYEMSGTDRLWVGYAPGLFSDQAVTAPGTFSGHLTVDLPTNTVLAVDLTTAPLPFERPVGFVAMPMLWHWHFETETVESIPPEFRIILPNIWLAGGGVTLFLNIDLSNGTVSGNSDMPGCGSRCAMFVSGLTGTIAPAVPEPATWAMMLIGFAGVGFMTWRKRSRSVVAEAGTNARNVQPLIRIPVAANGLQRL